MNDHDAKPKDDGAESLSTAGLGVVLHDTIEAAQGRSYISDGIGHLPDGEVVRISECSLGCENERTTKPDSAASVLSAGLGGWVPMSEKVPEPDTVCVVWCRYSRDTKGFATVDTWALQHEDPLGMGGPTIPTGYGWDDNYESDVLYWMALPAKPDESIDQRWEETPNDPNSGAARGPIAGGPLE